MITSYNLNGNTYEFLSGATVEERFYLPDSRLEAPVSGDTTGVRIYEDSKNHSLVLSASELLAMGFATVALFTTQFNADKSDFSIRNIDEGSEAAMQTKSVLITDAALGAGATKVIAVAVPDGAVILGAQLNVDLAVTTSGGDNTFDAAFSGGDTTAIATGISGALNTKTDALFVPILTTGVTNITVTAGNAENFATGTIQALVYYRELVSMGNA